MVWVILADFFSGRGAGRALESPATLESLWLTRGHYGDSVKAPAGLNKSRQREILISGKRRRKVRMQKPVTYQNPIRKCL